MEEEGIEDGEVEETRRVQTLRREDLKRCTTICSSPIGVLCACVYMGVCMHMCVSKWRDGHNERG